MKLRTLALLLVVVVASVIVGPPGQTASSTKGEDTARRQWVTRAGNTPISPAQYEVVRQPIAIPTRDGHVLNGIVYVPARAPAEGPGPCVGVLEGYSPPSIVGIEIIIYEPILSDLAARGYASAYVYMRGATAPPDQGLYYKYASDGYDIVEWMAQQSWCNGRVGLRGTSLQGITQSFAAKALPPHLKAIAPDVPCGDCYWDLWYPGGMLPGAGRRGRRPPATASDEYGAAVQHRNYDAWWRERTIMPADRAKIARKGVKMLVFGGWNDYMLGSYSRIYREYRAAKGEAKLILGPWGHGEPFQGAGQPILPYSFNDYHVRFFDRWLKGIRNGYDREGTALLFVEGPNQWRFEKRFPIPDTNNVRFHLRATRSRTASSINDGSLTFARPRSRERSVTYSYSPSGPFNSGGAGSARLANDQRPDERRSVTWTSPAVRTPTEMTGWPKLTFWARVQGVDTDFVAELTDVAPDGTSRQIARGWLNAQRFFSRSNPKALRAGRVHRFEMELWPAAYVLDKGHRFRISLSGSDNPGTDPNPNSSRVTILQDAAHPSSIVLPLIGDSRLVRAYRASAQ